MMQMANTGWFCAILNLQMIVTTSMEDFGIGCYRCNLRAFIYASRVITKPYQQAANCNEFGTLEYDIMLHDYTN